MSLREGCSRVNLAEPGGSRRVDGQRLGPRCCGNAKSPEPSLPPRLEGLEAAFVCRFSRPSMCLLGTQLRFCLFFKKNKSPVCGQMALCVREVGGARVRASSSELAGPRSAQRVAPGTSGAPVRRGCSPGGRRGCGAGQGAGSWVTRAPFARGGRFLEV